MGTFETVLEISKIIGAVGVIAGFIIMIAERLIKLKAQQSEITRLKQENTLICFALAACLDGLEQLGANHTVTKAKDKLDKYLNTMAHK